MTYLEVYQAWRDDPFFDEETRNELKAIEKDDAEIRDRFCKDLEFGTGGLRGVLGAGTNRMNIYTVGKATQGLANYILGQGMGAERGVAIAYDCRHGSKEFADVAASCLCGNGIRTFLFDRLTPTPLLSFAVRRLGCIAGIVVTASHNPAEYNGYKVYWEDGAQVTAPRDREIITQVQAVGDFSKVKRMGEKEAVDCGLLVTLGDAMEQEYREAISRYVLNPETVRRMGGRLKLVYTPLHGTGDLPVRHLLEQIGFTDVAVVAEQQQPDGDFHTVVYPNPEDEGAFEMALEMAKDTRADLALATDPDADRVGMYVRGNDGEYHAFTGNMSGVLLCYYILSQKKEKGLLPLNGVVVKTIVTTRMAEPVAEEFGVKLVDVLTGFKYIGEQMKLFEKEKTFTYQFGFEESYGCLVEDCVRDKDAVSAVMALCEAAAYYASRGITLWEQMQWLYDRYGYFKEGLVSQTLKGEEGAARIRRRMEAMRSEAPRQLGGCWVEEVEDYQAGVITNVKTGEMRPTGLPRSNVLRYRLSGDAWCCVRPSGTEPKIKYYFGVKGRSEQDAERRLLCLRQDIRSLGETPVCVW